MSAALRKIQAIVYQVRTLDLRPLEAVNRIGELLAEAGARQPLPLPTDPVPMTARTWLALCGCIFIIGLLSGWGLRTHTTRDQYMYSLARQAQAAENYYNGLIKTAIEDNKRSLKSGK